VESRRGIEVGERPLRAFISSVMQPEMEWARAAAVAALRENPVLVPWAFEFTPASSDAATETYLNKVREADFVVWLVGGATSDAVRDEIAEALAADRRLWVIRIPADERDARTNELLAEVGQRAKYADAADADQLRVVLALTFADEVVRALSETPGLTHLARLEQLARASRARMVQRWQAVGLPEAEAVAFADDPSVGAPAADLVPTPESPLRVVVGDVGAGKSVLAERALQGAIIEARERATAPFPVFLHAYETVATGLETSMTTAAQGLGDVRVQGHYADQMRLHVLPTLGRRRLADLGPRDISGSPPTCVRRACRRTASVSRSRRCGACVRTRLRTK
jgi:hypothetical protein